MIDLQPHTAFFGHQKRKNKRHPDKIGILVALLILVAIVVKIRLDYDPVRDMAQQSCELIFGDTLKLAEIHQFTSAQYEEACRAETQDLMIVYPAIVERCIPEGYTFMLQCLRENDAEFHGRYIEALTQ